MLGILAALFSTLEGSYLVTGYDNSETKKWYQGSAEITKAGDVYHVTWEFLLDGKEYNDIGTGIRVGDQFSIVFKSIPSQELQYEGLEVLKIKGDSLEGPYVLFGEKKLGFERMKKTE